MIRAALFSSLLLGFRFYGYVPPAKPDAPTPADIEAFKAIVASSSTFTGWAFALFAGSLLVILSTTYHRPKSRGMRLGYLLFVPGWACLAVSIYYASLVQEHYLASLLNARADRHALRVSFGEHAAQQSLFFQAGLLFFGLWLLIFLIWWIFSESIGAKEEASPHESIIISPAIFRVLRKRVVAPRRL